MEKDRVIKIIKRAKKNKQKILDLSREGIIEIPKEIERLVELRELNLSYNRLQSLPKEIGNLANLRKINLSSNQLQSLPKEIGNLANLRELNLSYNRLQSLPKEIGNLANLRELNLSYNRLQFLPQGIKNLTNLIKLNLFNIKLKVLPKEIGNLANLREINLSSNQLKVLPKGIGNLANLREINLSSNQLKVLPKGIGKLKNLEGLYFDEEKITNVDIVTMRQGVKAIKSFLRQKENKKLYEAKLILVGQKKVGKSFLVERMTTDEDSEWSEEYISKLEEEKKNTKGIDVTKWYPKIEIEIEKKKKKEKFKINVWDFSGEEIDYQLHQFFLTRSSFYIFLWEAETGYSTYFDYWLNIIRLLSRDKNGESAPVVVVLNKIDKPSGKQLIDEASAQEKFKNIVDFCPISVHKGTGTKDLRRLVKKEIKGLKHIGEPQPKSWNQIRKKLEELDKNYISYQKYLEICDEVCEEQKINKLNKEDKEILSERFHILGTVLHFKEDPVLKKTIILKREWATKAAYKIFEDDEIKKNNGQTDFEHLKELWKKYTSEDGEKREEEYEYLLKLMKKFNLCFKRKEKIYIPQHLSYKKPDKYKWNTENNLRFEYRYKFMPPGIIEKFIVKTHQQMDGNMFWKNGVILKGGGVKTLITRDIDAKKVEIFVRGIDRKKALENIIEEFADIHEELNNLDVEEMIACDCRVCRKAEKEKDEAPYFYSYRDLMLFHINNIEEIYCKKSLEHKDPERQVVLKILGKVVCINIRSILKRASVEGMAGIEFRTRIIDELSEAKEELEKTFEITDKEKQKNIELVKNLLKELKESKPNRKKIKQFFEKVVLADDLSSIIFKYAGAIYLLEKMVIK